MNNRQQILFARLEHHQIGRNDIALSFPKRLARENRWPLPYANRVVTEYKKFLFLAMEAGHPVTPSDQVDQVWHLHLTYTRDYWEKVCGEILGTPLHHGPTQGGQEENEKYDLCYRRTLASYERVFGEAPPKDIWPEPEIRFGHDVHFRRVNTEDNWIIPKLSPVPALSVGLSLSALAFVGCQDTLSPHAQMFLSFYIPLAVFCTLLSLFLSLRAVNRQLPLGMATLWPILLSLFIGGTKLILGVIAGKPVGILVFLIIFQLISCAIFSNNGTHRGSGKSDSSSCSSHSSGCSSSGCGGCGGGD